MQSQMLHGRIWIIAVEFPHRVRIKFRPLTHIYGQNSPSALATQLLGWGAAHSPLSHRSRPSRASPKKHRWLFAPAHPASALGLNFPPGSPNGQANLHGYFSFFLSFHPSHHFPGNHFVWSKVTKLTKSTRTKGTISRSPIVAGKYICVLPQRRGRAERGFFLLG